MLYEHSVSHPILGTYLQRVYATMEEAGHKPLASEGIFGWSMPTEPATERFIASVTNQIVMDVGAGTGEIVAMPALRAGAKCLFAADVVAKDLAEKAWLQTTARAEGYQEKLVPLVIAPDWWARPLQLQPVLAQMIGLPELQAELPNGSLDQMIARHSLQFGDPDTVLRFFDLASAGLRAEGQATIINFTPYTHYLFAYDGGLTMARIMELNEQYAAGEIDQPGGYVHSQKGLTRTSVSQLMGRAELDRGSENSFIYFDIPTAIGLHRAWANSRIARGLPVDLVIKENFCFTPSSIAKFNKLTENETVLERENHVLVLEKRAVK